MACKIRNAVVALCLAFAIIQSTFPVTILYSMKIRRVFQAARQMIGKEEDESIWTFTAVPIVYTRRRHFEACAPRVDIHEKRLLVGSVFDLRCTPSNNTWFEITTAFEYERAKAKGCSDDPFLPVCPKISKAGMDDITIAAGYHLFPTDDAQLDFYLIAGFPTHTKISRDDALGVFLGTRFFSIGGGAEYSYAFIQSIPRSFTVIGQARCIHFFDRDWFPVLPCGSTIQPGETFDLLLAFRYREKLNIFETGYNPTFFLNQAVEIPGQPKLRTDDSVRNGAYITYQRIFLRPRHPISLGAGFDFNRSKFLETRIYAGWVSVSVAF